MISENWRIFLDYTSERNAAKLSPNRACVLLFWEVKLFKLRMNISFYSKTICLQHVNGTSRPKYTVFPDFLNAQIIDVFYGKASPLGLTAYPFLISQATNKWCSFDMYTYNTVEPRLTATFCDRTANGHTFSCKKITLVNMVTRLIIRSIFFSPLVTVLTGCTRPF